MTKRKSASAGNGSDAPPEAGAAAAARDSGAGAAALATQATLFIRKAASVLEREVAAGIGAAQMLESQFVNVPELRNRSSDELMQRFRKDGHQLFELIMDMLTLGVDAIESVATRAIRITAASSPEAGAAGSPRPGVPTLSPAGPARPGDTVSLELALENASDEVRDVAGFQVTDLIAANGARIEAVNIAFRPVPLSVPAQGKAVLNVAIAIPAGTGPGIYSALMMVREMDEVRALIAIEVTEAAPEAAARP